MIAAQTLATFEQYNTPDNQMKKRLTVNGRTYEEDVEVIFKGKGTLKCDEFTIDAAEFTSLVDCISATMALKNGDIYKGSIVDLKQHGVGRLTEKNEAGKNITYAGQFVRGQKHGIGRLLSVNDEGGIDEIFVQYENGKKISESEDLTEEMIHFSQLVQNEYCQLLKEKQPKHIERDKNRQILDFKQIHLKQIGHTVKLGNSLLNNQSIAFLSTNNDLIIADDTRKISIHSICYFVTKNSFSVESNASNIVELMPETYAISFNTSPYLIMCKMKPKPIGIKLKEKSAVYAIANQHNKIYSGGFSRILKQFDEKSYLPLLELKGHSGYIYDIAPINQNLVASCSALNKPHEIKIWDLRNKMCTSSINTQFQNYSLTYNPQNQLLVGTCYGGRVVFYNYSNQSSFLHISENKSIYSLCHFNNIYVFGGQSKIMHLLNLNNRKHGINEDLKIEHPIRTLKHYKGTDVDYVVLGQEDGSVSTYNLDY